MSKIREDIVERRRELFFPKALNLFTRARLWVRGYRDAHAGEVRLSTEQFITSPYCEAVARETDKRINAEWQESNGIMFELRPALEQAIRERDEVIRQIEKLPVLKKQMMDTAKIEYSGDTHVSNHLAEKRRNRRIALVEVEFESREKALRSRLNQASAVVSEILADYQDAKDASEIHERLARIDYLARLSCYARGASRKIRIDPKWINDRALTRCPRQDSMDYFDACVKKSGIKDGAAESQQQGR